MVDDDLENLKVWETLPGMFFRADAKKLRPAATALLRGPNDSIVAAVHRAGAGYSIFLATDDLWRWRASRLEGLHERFWAATVRYLAAGKKLAGNQDGTLYVDRDRYDLGETIEIEGSLLDARNRPVVRSHLIVPVGFSAPIGTDRLESGQPDDSTSSSDNEARGVPKTIQLNPVADRPGWYRGSLVAAASGFYSLETEAGAEASFEVVRLTAESEDPSPDVYALADIAGRTGGELLGVHQVGELPELIPDRTVVEVVGRAATTLWDSPLILILLAALLVTEWVLRKLWRLH